MKIIFISGSGAGAGKTTLAEKLTNGHHQVFSVANTIRFEISKKYPKYDWYNKSTGYKNTTIVKETNMSLKQMMDKYGREKKEKNPLYWAKEMLNALDYAKDNEKLELAVIDDLRFVDEMKFIKSHFHNDASCHFHIENPNAIPEPHYENDKLQECADYIININFKK